MTSTREGAGLDISDFARRPGDTSTRLRIRICLAKFPAMKTLAGFDFDAQLGVDRRLIGDLSTLSLVDRTDNVRFLGTPGVGKSHLAIGLAIRA